MWLRRRGGLRRSGRQHGGSTILREALGGGGDKVAHGVQPEAGAMKEAAKMMVAWVARAGEVAEGDREGGGGGASRTSEVRRLSETEAEAARLKAEEIYKAIFIEQAYEARNKNMKVWKPLPRVIAFPAPGIY